MSTVNIPLLAVPSADWPRGFLLKIYEQAVEHGVIVLEPISQADAVTLRARLYRLRRRADTSMAPFIAPEYHLVSVGRWHDDKLPIIYDRLPDSIPLPSIRPASSDELDALEISVMPIPLADPTTLLGNLEAVDLDLRPEEVDSFVDDLIKSAKERRS